MADQFSVRRAMRQRNSSPAPRIVAALAERGDAANDRVYTSEL
jgi:hypothetical protein